MSEQITETDEWKSLRIKPKTHRRFKELAARKGTSLDGAAEYALDAVEEKESVTPQVESAAPDADRPAAA